MTKVAADGAEKKARVRLSNNLIKCKVCLGVMWIPRGYKDGGWVTWAQLSFQLRAVCRRDQRQVRLAAKPSKYWTTIGLVASRRSTDGGKM